MSSGFQWILGNSIFFWLKNRSSWMRKLENVWSCSHQYSFLICLTRNQTPFKKQTLSSWQCQMQTAANQQERSAQSEGVEKVHMPLEQWVGYRSICSKSTVRMIGYGQKGTGDTDIWKRSCKIVSLGIQTTTGEYSPHCPAAFSVRSLGLGPVVATITWSLQ